MVSSSKKTTAPERRVGALYCWVANVSALAVAAVVIGLPSTIDPLWCGLLANVAATVVVWCFSFGSGNSSIYDPYWALAPPMLAVWLKGSNGGGYELWHSRQVLVLSLVLAWAMRFHVLYPWCGWFSGLVEEDWRYADIRRSMPKVADTEMVYWGFSLTSLHLTPTLLVFFAFAPAATVLATLPSSQAPLNIIDALATAATVLALLHEARADETLRRFRVRLRERKKSADTICREGPWCCSRHPNYFGECCFWMGLLGFAIAMVGPPGGGAERGLSQMTIPLTRPVWLPAGPVVMYLFFRFASVPLMDKRSLARRPGYGKVMATTPAMAPFSVTFFRSILSGPGGSGHQKGE